MVLLQVLYNRFWLGWGKAKTVKAQIKGLGRACPTARWIAEDAGPGFVATSLVIRCSSQLLTFLSSEHHFLKHTSCFSRLFFHPKHLQGRQLWCRHSLPEAAASLAAAYSPSLASEPASTQQQGIVSGSKSPKNQSRGKKGTWLSARPDCPSTLAGGHASTTADPREGLPPQPGYSSMHTCSHLQLYHM